MEEAPDCRLLALLLRGLHVHTDPPKECVGYLLVGLAAAWCGSPAVDYFSSEAAENESSQDESRQLVYPDDVG